MIAPTTLAVAELRRMLAIDEHKYTLIKDFRRRVIDIAQREVNAKTDLCFEYDPIKTGRKVQLSSNVDPDVLLVDGDLARALLAALAVWSISLWVSASTRATVAVGTGFLPGGISSIIL